MKNVKISFVFITLTCLSLSACQKDQASVDIGKEYGQSKTIKDCNNRAFQILIESNSGEGYSTTPHDFAFGCSLTAKNDKEYCKDIPVNSIFQSVKWKDAQCVDHNNSKACEKILKHAVGRCIVDREVNAKSVEVEKQPVKASPTI